MRVTMSRSSSAVTAARPYLRSPCHCLTLLDQQQRSRRVHVCELLLRALQLGLQIDQELLLVRAQTHLFRELAAGSRKGSRSPTGFFPHAAQLCVRLLQLRVSAV